jgi:uroporphyrinogen decarboxylase
MAASTPTPREKFIMALEGRQPPGRVPHFELVFFLTMEAFGRIHPAQRHYGQWNQMSAAERALHRRDIADLHVRTARRFEQSAVLFAAPDGWGDDYDDQALATLEEMRRLCGPELCLLHHGDTTYNLPDGSHMMEFVESLAERPAHMKDQAARRVDAALERAARWRRSGVLDGWALCSDYCFNNAPFLSPAMFDEFVTPYLVHLVGGYRELGYYVIKHTDGNIMPILDSLLAARPHALHSLDPQGKVDLAEVKRRCGRQVCLIGNVNCAMLQTGSDEQVAADVRRALRDGMPGGGYIFSTSNCIYTGMELRRYELMLDIWRREGNYPA